MSYLSDQKGIIIKYINEEGAWENHLANTKKYIIDSLKDKKIKSVAILGSGWLLDVPLEFLVNNFERILFFDINHPQQIKHKVRKFENIELKNADISGGAILSVYNLVRNYNKERIKAAINKIEFSGFKPDEQPDYIVSLNILNQLDMLLVDYLKKYSIYDDNELNYLRTRIQKSHIDSLIPDKSCLITDYEEEVYNTDGTLDYIKNLVFTNLPEGKNRKTWQWNFDSSSNYYQAKKTIFNIVAMEI